MTTLPYSVERGAHGYHQVVRYSSHAAVTSRYIVEDNLPRKSAYELCRKYNKRFKAAQQDPVFSMLSTCCKASQILDETQGTYFCGACGAERP